MNIKANTVTVHERKHRVVLSQGQVEALLSSILEKELDVIRSISAFEFSWGEETFDSGLRRRPQIVVTVTEDLAKLPSAKP